MNVSNIFDPLDIPGPSLTESQATGFPVGGESLAVDLADTLVTVTEPATDLLTDQGTCDRFWRLHTPSLPTGATLPTLEATRRLRDALRRLLDAAQQGVAMERSDVEIINAVSDAAPVALNLVAVADGFADRVGRWHASDPADVALAAAARSGIELLGDRAQRANLRRCASPACSMLFVKGDGRRRWCTPNICGNRDRAARHYRRHRSDA